MAVNPKTYPVTAVHWRKSYRIIPSRFPPISLFEGLVDDPDDLEALHELEGLTANRLREAAGEIHLIPPEDRRVGLGYTPVMAAVCYPAKSRFSDGSFGAYYCANSESTAVAETRYHRERFMQDSHERPMTLEMRVYIAELNAPLVDLRELQSDAGGLLDPNSWARGQRFGYEAWVARHYGIVYPSVRSEQPNAECAAIFRPPALGPTQQGKHLGYRWNGERITDIIELRKTDY